MSVFHFFRIFVAIYVIHSLFFPIADKVGWIKEEHVERQKQFHCFSNDKC
ncbi:hypothetical protein PROVRETT_06905 [Providencia rettgeri DSM 1131]|nr:hypothetical protein PROVRETT_06905 [Providencia rettgeri DSM 1131]